MKGQAQSFSETGNFYFTGSHRPLQSGRTQFREFMGGDGLKVGPVQLHPFFGVAEVFTDNVFRRKTDRKSDFLTTLAPGLQA
ncbi:MAG TPA: hypothetical protein PKK23_15205, partial [Nitrospirales bacterium]|nr:hypothetical protein [Nitrospirales bacterium]